MTDEILEQHLRKLPASQLPETWRTEILSAAIRKARPSAPSRQIWPPLLITLRNLFARNPVTASALTTLWMLIFLFKTSTPVDSSENELIAHFDPRQPIYFVSLQYEIHIAHLLQDQPEQRQNLQIP